MAQQVSKRSRGWVWVLVAVAAGFALYIYLHNRRDEVEVRAAKAELQTITQTKSTNGRVEPLENFDAHAPLAGMVNTIYVQLDQKVQAGQELLRMDDTDARKNLATAEANLASSTALLQTMEQGGTKAERLASTGDIHTAKMQVQQDSDSLAALEKLQMQGAASANEVAQAQHLLSGAEMRLTQAQAQTGARYSGGDVQAQRAQVAGAQAAVQAAQAAYAGVDIRAPFAGTVYGLPVAAYQFVPAGEALIQVANLTKMQITAYFDEPEIGQLKAGQPVSIEWPAKPGEEWHGHVTEAPTTIITYGGTRNVGECLISVDDANGALLPNTNVTVKVTESRRENVLSLPREALHTEGPEGMADYVYRIVNHHLVRTPVVVGLINLQRFEIVSGVKQGELVALGATTEVDLSDGLRVKVHP